MRGLSLVRRMEHQRKGCIKPSQAPWGPRFFGAAAVVLACVLSSGTGAATTWHVPGDAPTIQAGIDLAQAGDDVLVAPGEYREHDIVMKAGIWVHSEGGPSITTVDASGVGTGFICANLQPEATIEGLTILRGHAYGYDQHEGSGGGVRCIGSRLAIRDCVVTGCVSDEAYGGGIYAHASNVNIEACRVTDCSAAYDGGGIYTWCWAEAVAIADCEVLDNHAGASAGGIALSANMPETVDLTEFSVEGEQG